MMLSEPRQRVEKPLAAECIAVRGWIRGDHSAFELAEVAASETLESPPFKYQVPIAVVARGRMALLGSEIGVIRWAYDEFTNLASLTPRVAFFTESQEFLGSLATGLELYDDAEAHFKRSLLNCENGGFKVNLGWTLFEYGQMLLKRDGPGDQAQAMELLDQALRLARDIGMPPLMERVLARREILGA